ncbi:Flagellar assembly protein FliH [Labilithrix luteola]|uniref:Flagellar assembly protein FliH n=1 Tax=Labilithrix luteola TaxID=1391654 RepID=A0A0K1PUX1_9BACT|nr:FliH/SctL family protein [Labilithrix luteola]AKU96929.1 Flagellar assembly protein FliH [Labilithrix luteola]
MSIEHARIIKGAFASDPSSAKHTHPQETPRVDLARRIPRATLNGIEEAERIVREAKAQATALVDEARAAVAKLQSEAATEARRQEVARVAAELIAVRALEEQRRERELDRTVELAVLLAERLVGEALRVDPARIASLASEALRETRGARKLRIEAHPEDVLMLTEALGLLGAHAAEVFGNGELGRGSLLVQTELGRLDARLEPQLMRLAEALKEVLRAPAGIQARMENAVRSGAE